MVVLPTLGVTHRKNLEEEMGANVGNTRYVCQPALIDPVSLTCLVSGACWQRDGCFTDNSFNLENNLLRVVKKISAGCSKGCCWKSCCGECDMGAPRWRCPAKAKLNRSPSKLCIPEIPFSNFFRSCTFLKESPLPIPRSLFRRRAIQGQLTIEKKKKSQKI